MSDSNSYLGLGTSALGHFGGSQIIHRVTCLLCDLGRLLSFSVSQFPHPLKEITLAPGVSTAVILNESTYA